MSGVIMSIPKVSAPQISVSAIKTDLSLPSFGSATSNIGSTISSATSNIGSTIGSAVTKNIPSISAPNLNVSLPGISSIQGGISSAFGGATSLAEGLKPQLPSIPTNINLTKFTFQKPVSFPGLDKVGRVIGAGPKFLSQTLTKFNSVVPPFIPGVPINMAMIGGALTVIKAVASANPAQLLKQITQNYADDLKGQLGGAIDTTAINDLKNQVQTVQDSLASANEAFKETVANIQETSAAVTETITSVQETATSVVSSATSNVTSQVNNAVSQATTTRINAFGFPPTG